MLIFKKSIYEDFFSSKKVKFGLFFKSQSGPDRAKDLELNADDFSKIKAPFHSVELSGGVHPLDTKQGILTDIGDHVKIAGEPVGIHVTHLVAEPEKTDVKPRILHPTVNQISADGVQLTRPQIGLAHPEQAEQRGTWNRITNTGKRLVERFVKFPKTTYPPIEDGTIDTHGQESDKSIAHAGGSVLMEALPMKFIHTEGFRPKIIDLLKKTISQGMLERVFVSASGLIGSSPINAFNPQKTLLRTDQDDVDKHIYWHSMTDGTKKLLKTFFGWEQGGTKGLLSLNHQKLTDRLYKPISLLGIPLHHFIGHHDSLLTPLPEATEGSNINPNTIRDHLADLYKHEDFEKLLNSTALTDDNREKIRSHADRFEKDPENGQWVEKSLRKEHLKEILDNLIPAKDSDSEDISNLARKVTEDWSDASILRNKETSKGMRAKEPDARFNGNIGVALPFGGVFGWPNAKKNIERWHEEVIEKLVAARRKSNLPFDELYKKWKTTPGKLFETDEEKQKWKDAFSNLPDGIKNGILKIFGNAEDNGIFAPGTEQESLSDFQNRNLSGHKGGTWTLNARKLVDFLTFRGNGQADIETIKKKALQYMREQPGIVAPVDATGRRVTVTSGITTIAGNDREYLPDGSEPIGTAGAFQDIHRDIPSDVSKFSVAEPPELGTAPIQMENGNLFFRLRPPTTGAETMFAHVRFEDNFTKMHVLIYRENPDGSLYKSTKNFDKILDGLNPDQKKSFFAANPLWKKAPPTPISQVTYEVADEIKNPDFELKNDEPTDDEYIASFLRSNSGTNYGTPKDQIEDRKKISVWEKHNSDGDKYVLLKRKIEEGSLAGELKEKIEKWIKETRENSKYTVFTRGKPKNPSEKDFIELLDSTSISSKNILDSLSKTKQEYNAEQKIKIASRGGDSAQKRALYNYALSIVEDTMAQHAANQHFVAAIALKNSETPKMLDVNGNLIEQEPADGMMLNGAVGPADSPSMIIAKQAKISASPIVSPAGEHPSVTIRKLIDNDDILVKINEAEKDNTILQTGFTHPDALPKGVPLAEVASVMTAPNVSPVTDDERKIYGEKPSLAHDWVFPHSLVNDEYGSLAFFGVEQPEKTPITRKADLLKIVTNGLINKINNGKGLIIANNADEQVGDRVIMTEGQNLGFSLSANGKFITINGLTFSGTKRIDQENPANGNQATTNTGNSISISLKVKSGKDANGNTKYWVDMTPIRQQAQLLSHKMKANNNLFSSNLPSVRIAANNTLDAVLGNTNVPQLDLGVFRPSEITQISEIADHGNIHANLSNNQQFERLQSFTGWSIDPEIKEFFTKGLASLAAEGVNPSSIGRIVATRGNFAVVMLPVLSDTDYESEDKHTDDAIKPNSQYQQDLLGKKDKNYASLFFSKMFGRLADPKSLYLDMSGLFSKNNNEKLNLEKEVEEKRISKLWSGAQYLFRKFNAPKTLDDAHPDSYDQRKKLKKDEEKKLRRTAVHFVIIDTHNANTILNGASLLPGSKIAIKTDAKPDDDDMRFPYQSTNSFTNARDVEKWTLAKDIDRAEATLYTPDEREGYSIGFSFLKGNLEELARSDKKEIRDAATTLLSLKTEFEEFNEKEKLFNGNYDKDPETRTAAINEAFDKSQKEKDRIEKTEKQFAIHKISPSDVIYRVPPQSEQSSYTDAITDIFKIISSLNNGSQDQLLRNHQAIINSEATTIPSMQILKNIADDVTSSPSPLRAGINEDGIFDKFPEHGEFLKNHVFTIPEHYSRATTTDIPDYWTISPQDMRKTIGSFSKELLDILKSLKTNIVIHSGNKNSIESLPGGQGLSSSAVDGAETTWKASDGTIFWGSRSKNPLSDLYWQLCDSYVEKSMQDDDTKKAALDVLKIALKETDTSIPLIQKLREIDNDSADDEERTREVLRLFWIAKQGEAKNRINWTNAFENGRYPDGYEDLMQENTNGSKIEDHERIPVNTARDSGDRQSPALTTAAQTIRGRNGTTREVAITQYFENMLNDTQLAAIKQDNTGPTIVKGIPGSGKTKSLVALMLMLSSLYGIPQEQILMLTFSRDARRRVKDSFTAEKGKFATFLTEEGLTDKELRDKSKQNGILSFKTGDINDDRANPTIATTHSFALSLITGVDALDINGINYNTRTGTRKAFDPDLQLVGTNKQEEMITAIINQFTLPEQLALRALNTGEGSLSSTIATKIQAAKDTENMSEINENPVLQRIWHKYNEMLSSNDQLDYSDLISKVAKHLENNNHDRDKVRARYRHVMVDEFQDINLMQRRLIKAVTASNGANLTVVGDEHQAIYGFRGANTEFSDTTNFEKWHGLFNGSTRGKVKNVMLGVNYRARYILAQLATIFDGRNWISGKMGDTIGSASGTVNIFNAKSKSVKASMNEQDNYMASIIRKKFGSEARPDDLVRIPWTDKGAGVFVPPMAIICRTNKEAADLRKRLYDSKIEVAPSSKEMTLYQEMQEDFEGKPHDEEQKSGVVVINAHQSKGSEFETVFLYNVTDDRWPHSRISESKDEKDYEIAREQEENLFYVAMTRAENELHICTASKGKSPFLVELLKKINQKRSMYTENS